MSSGQISSQLVSSSQLASEAQGSAAQLVLRNVGVNFGAVRALEDVSLTMRPGEIVGLIGHNGAGKSTLFNVVSGALAASHGTVEVGGVLAGPQPTPKAMAHMGITVIHQEPALAHNLPVIDNLFLGQEALMDEGHRRQQAAKALDAVGAEISLTREVSTLGLGERQLVDLARGMVRGKMRVLMLDEPTAALGQAETDTLHGLIRKLAAEGIAVIYVSHRLPDILDVCDRIVILRAGKVQSDGVASQYDGPSLARALAPEMERVSKRRAKQMSEERVAFSGVFSGIAARAGEVVGLFGMAAGRQFELLESAFGQNGKFRYFLDGKPVTVGSPKAAIRRGVHLVPGDRENDGLISGLRAVDTVFLPWFRSIPGRGNWIGAHAGKTVYREARGALQIVGPGGEAPIDEFSGGNRQKHLIARWTLVKHPKVLLLLQPTQGVDVGAKADIARAIDAIAAEGTTVIVASSEADEIDLLCDRSYVVVDTKFTQVERTERFAETLLTNLLTLAAGPGTEPMS